MLLGARRQSSKKINFGIGFNSPKRQNATFPDVQYPKGEQFMLPKNWEREQFMLPKNLEREQLLLLSNPERGQFLMHILEQPR